MKKIAFICLSFLLTAAFALSAAGCGKENSIDTLGDISDQQFTLLNTVATDALGRKTERSSGQKTDKDRYVGMFYFNWMGVHHRGVYDVTKLLEENPDALWDPYNTTDSPVNAYHVWGEPLFGYYNSSDPWVVDRHVEMLTMLGVDFLVFDATNAVLYHSSYQQVLKTLDKYQKQGWDVPKVVWFTNSSSKQTAWQIYDTYYTEPAAGEENDSYYPDLWFSPEGKPMIIGDKWNFSFEGEDAERDQWLINEYFDFRQAQWPDKNPQENSFPWIEFEYPQYDHNGIVSVSVAQHTSSKMSNEDFGNRGRGFDMDTMKNDSSRMREGLNYQSQWQTVFDMESAGKDVDIAFVTGWNEWTMIKFAEKVSATEQKVYFVDAFNEEYSRDIEPMKGGYGDNFYLQTLKNIRAYKYEEDKNYRQKFAAKSLDSFGEWEGLYTYKDFAGDAMVRDYRGIVDTPEYHYTDTSARNDITDIQIANDSEYLYLKISTLAPVTSYEQGDESWMNILLGTGNEKNKTFEGYDFVVNRHPSSDGTTSVEKSTGGYAFSEAGKAEYRVSGNQIIVKVPLKALGLKDSKSLSLKVKVTDHISNPQDIMDYYVSGDSAPIGRLSYDYASKK